MPRTVVSRAEFARRRNITRGYVTQLIDKGKIPPSAVNSDGSIDFEKAVEALKQNIAPYNQKKNIKPGNSNYYVEKAEHEKIKKSLSQLELDEKLGNLIHKNEVIRIMTRAATNCKSRLLSIPTKAAPQMMGADSLEDAKKILKIYIVEALQELSTFDPKLYSNDNKDSTDKTVKDKPLKGNLEVNRKPKKSKKKSKTRRAAPGRPPAGTVKDRKAKKGKSNAGK
jgi:hypothetical protein